MLPVAVVEEIHVAIAVEIGKAGFEDAGSANELWELDAVADAEAGGDYDTLWIDGNLKGPGRH